MNPNEDCHDDMVVLGISINPEQELGSLCFWLPNHFFWNPSFAPSFHSAEDRKSPPRRVLNQPKRPCFYGVRGVCSWYGGGDSSMFDG